MTSAWSEFLVEMPVLWDLCLRISIVLIVAWGLHLAIARCNPRWRVQLWRFTQVALTIVAIATFLPGIAISVERRMEKPVGDGEAGPHLAPRAPLLRGFGDSSSLAELPPVYEWHEPPLDTFVPQVEAAKAEGDLSTASPTHVARWITKRGNVLLAGIWLLGTAFLIVRWSSAQIRIRGVLARSQTAPKRCSQALRQVADRLETFRNCELRLSRETDVPFVAGLWHPIVVLPPRMAARRFASELPAIFAHELSHVKSHDLIWMGVSQWIAIPLWFHPLSWKITSVHSLACEEVADAVAADSVGDVARYSGTLARVALAAASYPPAMAAISMTRPSQVMSRLARLKRGLLNTPLSRRRLILSIIVGLLAVVPLAMIKLAYADEGTTTSPAFDIDGPTRVLHFPEDHSVGRLSIATEKESEWWDKYAKRFDYRRDWDWQYYALAQGDVTVPENAQVKLEIKSTGADDTSWIKQLRPDDLYEIFVFPHPANEDPYSFGDEQLQHLSHLTGLKELTIQFVQVTGRGLQALKPLTELEKLVFYSTTTDNSTLESIGQLRSLQVLELGKGNWNDAGLAYLSELDQLEELLLMYGGVPGRGFDAVAKLPKLKYLSGMYFKSAHLAKLRKSQSLRALNLQQSEFLDDDSLKYIAHLPQLEYLDLWHTNITDAGVRHLRPLKALKRLNIKANRLRTGPAITVASAGSIAEMSRLENLVAPDVGDVDGFLAGITNLKNLESLMIGGRRDTGWLTDAGVKQLTNFPKLERLAIDSTNLTDAAADHLAQLSELKWLSLLSDTMTDDGLAKLSALKQLRYINILGNPKRGKFTFSGVTRLNGLPNLTSLWYYSRPVQPGEPALDFSGMPRLEKLGMTGLRDQDIAGLKECKNLKWLQGSDLTDQGIAQLETFPHLERLSISGQNISDESLIHLAEMNEMNHLTINAPITEKALPHIERLKSLEALTIGTPNQFSAASVDQLKNNLPNLRFFTFNGDRANVKLPQKKLLPYGKEAPPFEVTLLGGKKVSLKDYQGKVLLLYFWSTNCKPCVASVPSFKKAYAELSKYQDFAMIALSGDDSEARWKDFIRKNKIPWPQARIGDQSKMALAYGVAGYPRYVVIGRDGKILTSVAAEVDSALRKALEVDGE